MRPATDAVADTRYLVTGAAPTVDGDQWDDRGPLGRLWDRRAAQITDPQRVE
ncbi:hypothetical protein [Micromonospora sp. DT229]|uniref:hypothetical protein n=1 Tax=Micromonospora sp. DT229 TaxID=3393430 RepID=UPI003CF29DA1